MEIKNLNLQKQIDELKLLQDNWLDKVFPIGSIYKSVDSTSPEELFGGAWMSWGQGKVPVGVDSNDNDFSGVEKTGGEKIHTLTVNELPSHTHMLHLVSTQLGNGGVRWGTTYSQYDGNVDTYSTGNSQPHNNLQPYETLYMWKRVEPGYYLEYTLKDSTSHSEFISTEEELKSRIQEINIEQEGQRIQRNLKTCKIISNGVKIKDCSGLFSKCEGLTSVDLSELDTSEATDMSTMFTSCNGLVTLDLSTLNTSNVTDMGAMFSYCQNLTELDLSNFDTSNVTNMTGMFYYCDDLITLKLSKFNTSNVRDMGQMFYRCQKLTGLDLLTFDTQNVKNMNSMFYCCYDLKSLDLSSFNTSNVIDMNNMFYWCESLTSLDIQNFDFSKITITSFNKMLENVPSNCLITVKDQVAKNFVLSIRSDLTNVQIKS